MRSVTLTPLGALGEGLDEPYVRPSGAMTPRKIARWLGIAAGAIAALVLLGVGALWLASSRVIDRAYAAHPEHLAAPTPAQLADAPRQALLLGCAGCHGDGLRGRRMFHEPGVATVWAPNLPEIAAHATDQQLARAIRQGIGVDGRGLWIMPSDLFSRLTDREVAALIAYIRTLPRKGEATPPILLGLMGRAGIALGEFKPIPAALVDYRTRTPLDAGVAHARGRRIAETVCAGCHGPDLTGGFAGPDHPAPDLEIVGAYDLQQFSRLIRTGRPLSGAELAVMSPTSRRELSHFTDEEIAALYGYLSARANRLAR